MRIASLLPSATEIVCALGCEAQLVGVSHSCNYPPSVLELPNMTSTRVPIDSSSDVIDRFVREHLLANDALYDLDLPSLEKAAPDLVVSQALCDVCAVSTGDVVLAIKSINSRPELIDLEPNTLDDVFNDIERVALALGVRDRGADLLSSLRRRRDRVAERTRSIPRNERPRVAFLEWLLPPFNGGHWNPELISLAGGIDTLGRHGKPSATTSWAEVGAAAPDVVIVACCGLTPERTQHDLRSLASNEDWCSLAAVQKGRVVVVDGNAYFSSPGPRLIDGLEIIAHALHPEVHPAPTAD